MLKKDLILILSDLYKNNYRISNKLQSQYSKDLFFYQESGDTFNEKSYLLCNNIDQPICPICKVNKLKFISFKKGYQKNCSVKCSSNNPKTRKEEQKTKLEKYGSKTFNNRNKARDTIKDKYGVENVFQSQEVKNKIKKTNLKRYGIEYTMQNKEFSKKMVKTQKEKYGSLGFNTYKKDETMLKRYGNLNNYEKIKKTNQERYEVENLFQLKETQDKIRQIKLQKYGNEHYNNSKKIKETHLNKYDGIGFQSEEIKEKIKNTNQEKYNDKYYNNRDQINKTNLKKYGVENLFQSKEIQKKIRLIKNKNFYKNLLERNNNIIKPLFNIEDYNGINNIYQWLCKECNTEFYDHLDDGHIPRCPTCFPKLSGSSTGEKEVVDFIKLLGIKVEENNRSILEGKELDIFLPEHNLAIEYNGLYWHSELQNKENKYHLNKTIECEKKGIHLIHIFEDEWFDKNDIVKSIIKAQLGINDQIIYARKCQIKEVDDIKEFLNNNHLQGYINSRVNIGLYHDNKLVSLLTLGKSRYDKQYDWEILRFTNLINTKIIGSFARLLSYFNKNYEGSIITYSDRRYFNGSIYLNNGFKLSGISVPSYYYTDYKFRYNRQKFMKHKLSNLLENYNSNLTEWENMQLNGWDRIYDCGNYIFTKEN